MGETYKRISKTKSKKYVQKEFNVPIKVEGVIQNQFTGQEIALVSTKRDKWYVVHLGQDSAQDFGNDEAGARKEFKEWSDS